MDSNDATLKNRIKIFLFHLILITLFSTHLVAQKTYNKVKKFSNGNGTLFINWGYNRSYYSASEIRFRSRMYDFNLKEVKASDRQNKKIKEFLEPSSFTIPQYNFKAGYYYRNRYALAFSFDKMKYIMNDANQVFIDGYVGEGVDSVFSGKYTNQKIVLNSNDFNFENQVNYFRVDLTRTDKLYQNRSKDFALSLNLGLGLGLIANSSDFNFESNITRNRWSLSGLGITASSSLRFEFFKHFFLQAEISGGSIKQNKLKTRPFNKETFSSQQFWYGQRAIYAGILIYLKPMNSCNDCPVW